MVRAEFPFMVRVCFGRFFRDPCLLTGRRSNPLRVRLACWTTSLLGPILETRTESS